ncbi:MAG: hypothetical protein HY331_19105 [Chloroflexi bacterium]|nr:hypothetical protein [Chloroflexota bacterium]
MATTATGGISASSNRWYWTIAAALLVGGGAVAILLLTRSAMAPRALFDASQITTAAGLAAEHGQSMKNLGYRMVVHGRELKNDFWISQGEHWVADGDALIQRSKAVQNLPSHIYRNSAGQIAADARAVEADVLVLKGHGQAIKEHALVMKELTVLLQQRAQAAGDERLLQDAQESLRQSEAMERAGQQMLAAGDALGAWVGRGVDSLGSGR